MVAEIIGVGSVFMDNGVLDTNTRLIARELEACGIRINNRSAVGGNVQKLRGAIAQALSRSDVVIMMGGLGAGADGITKDTVCEGLGRRLVLHEESLRRIKEAYERAGRQMPQQIAKLAMLPEQSIVFPGSRGITPGCALSAGNQFIIMIPENSEEFIPMFQHSVVPYLAKFSSAAVVTRTINVFGLSEADVQATLGDLLRSQNPIVAIYPKQGELQVRVTARDISKQQASALCEPTIAQITKLLGEAVYGIDQGALQKLVVEELYEHQMSVAVGESCTGGLLAQMFTEVTGSAKVFEFGVSAYSSRIKQEALKVPEKLLKKFSSVSEQVAVAMAYGAMTQGKSTIGVGITGNAGGKGEDPKKTGLVYVAVCDSENVWVKKLVLPKTADRDYIRYMACMTALDLVRLYMRELPKKYPNANPLKTALMGKVSAVMTAGDAGKSSKSASSGKKGPWYSKIFPVKGDGPKEIFRKMILIIAVLVFVCSSTYIISFYSQSASNKKLSEDLASMYVEGMNETDMENVKVPDGYPKDYQKKFANLYKINSDIAGWIKIEDTQVNYPVVHYTDNDFYLRRDFNKKNNKHGVPWLDYHDKLNPQSDNYVIYGHNMTDGQMFGELMKYKGKDGLAFLQSHPIISLADVYRDNEYKIFSVFITNIDESYGEVFYYNTYIDLKDPAAFNTFIDEVKARSYYDSNIDIKQGDQFLTLSTCSYEFGPVADTDTRTVIVARRIRDGEKNDGSDITYQLNSDYKLPPGFKAPKTKPSAAAATSTQVQSIASSHATSTEQESSWEEESYWDEESSSMTSRQASRSEMEASRLASEAWEQEQERSAAASDAWIASSRAASDAWIASSKAASDAAASSKVSSSSSASSASSSTPASSSSSASSAIVSSSASSAASIVSEAPSVSQELVPPEENNNHDPPISSAPVEEVLSSSFVASQTSVSSSGSNKLSIISKGKKMTGSANDIVSKVVMNEMGGSFDEEALKAQAVAVYTYIKYQNKSGTTPYLGTATPTATVKNAVAQVSGEAVYSKNKLAFTPFYATSAGVTSASKDVWGGSYPYLVSVDSEIDQQAKNYKMTVSFDADTVADKVYNSLGIDLYDYSDDPEDWFEIISYTDGDRYVKNIRVGDETTTGRIVREQVLGLRSAAFDISYKSSTDKFTFTTYGYGHGVGLSQTGANLYASIEGWDYTQILEHYYPGTRVK
ncbi:class B sortase [Oscillospiraceae bacterium PP1C4]